MRNSTFNNKFYTNNIGKETPTNANHGRKYYV